MQVDINLRMHGLVVVVCLLALGGCQSAFDDEVFVSDLKEYTHRYYSGYFELDMINRIHYVYFQSQKDRGNDPVIFHMAGGPGCSALLNLFQENGPFIYPPNSSQLKLNPNSWNLRANVVYLDVPQGVGFSTPPPQQAITDSIVGRKGLDAIRLFFTRFPALLSNNVFLSGHGYSAVYASYISKAILEHNEVFKNFEIKLKGVLLGNPCVSPEECYATGSEKKSFYHYKFLYHRGYYSKRDYDEFAAACTLDYDKSSTCFTIRTTLNAKFQITNTSIYNIYDKCYKTLNNVINTGCEDEAPLIDHLNLNDTKNNWHIEPNSTIWTPCSKEVFDKYIGGNNSYHLIPYLIDRNVRVWVYSGDVDASVPIIGTKKWLQRLKAELELPIIKNWREWWVPGMHQLQDQVGGFVWQLKGITFATVKGAGFRAAKDKPIQMQEILNAFLDDQPLPPKSK